MMRRLRVLPAIPSKLMSHQTQGNMRSHRVKKALVDSLVHLFSFELKQGVLWWPWDEQSCSDWETANLTFLGQCVDLKFLLTHIWYKIFCLVSKNWNFPYFLIGTAFYAWLIWLSLFLYEYVIVWIRMSSTSSKYLETWSPIWALFGEGLGHFRMYGHAGESRSLGLDFASTKPCPLLIDLSAPVPAETCECSAVSSGPILLPRPPHYGFSLEAKGK